MKKRLLTLSATILLAGCSTYQEVSSDENTRVITTEQAGHLELNKEIKRPVLFRAADPLNAELLGVEPVGVNAQLKGSELVEEKLDATFIEPGDFETVESLDPDLIVTYAPDEYSATYRDYAPTIEMRYITSAFNPYKKRIYLTHFYYLGVMLNKEEEAKLIADEFLEKMSTLRSQLNQQVLDMNAAVIVDEDDTYYLRPKFSSFGTEAVYDVLGFSQPKYIKRILESDDYKIYETEDYSAAKLDYLFVATDDLNNDNKKEALAKAFDINVEQVIFMDIDNFRPNDLQSIEFQSKELIQTLNKLNH